jgi:uncharacterized Zn-finger protein
MSSANAQQTPCAQTRVEVTYDDLPLYCPTHAMSVWDAHPRVFLPIEETGSAKCPYCGSDYVLIDWYPHRGGH